MNLTGRLVLASGVPAASESFTIEPFVTRLAGLRIATNAITLTTDFDGTFEVILGVGQYILRHSTAEYRFSVPSSTDLTPVQLATLIKT